MNREIVSSCDPVIILGGGAIYADDLPAALSLCTTVVAADGGADIALRDNVELAAVIGDMDSISSTAFSQIPPDKRFAIAEQDSTDFDKALRHIEAPVILALGFCGGRIDHQLAVFHTLMRRPDRACIVLGERDIVFLCPPSLNLPVSPRTRVSLFPLGPVTGRSVGLEWPIEGLRFAPGVISGTSNRAIGPVHLEMDAPCMLCILPRSYLEPITQALMALSQEHGRWPVRAEQHKDPQRW